MVPAENDRHGAPMTPVFRLLLFLAIAAGLLAATTNAFAQAPAPTPPAPKPDMALNCPGLISAVRPPVVPAAFRVAALAADQVRLTYVGHSTFLIESPRLVRVATDYNDYVRPPLTPDIVTMNKAHSTHYTLSPDPGIKLVLRGWAEDGRPAGHDQTFGDVRVRSVATNIRSFGGTGTERHGNSIFVFEIAGLCIAHLGHLHHTLNQQQLNEIGRIDVVLVPVDGSYTLDVEGMIEVLQALKAPLMIPMHYFSSHTLNRFLDRMGTAYAVEFAETPSLVLSKSTLPAKPKFLVLPGH
jgi:L-ascorbate metabolism protein UlaG (beta-lactamase superfamily)